MPTSNVSNTLQVLDAILVRSPSTIITLILSFGLLVGSIWIGQNINLLPIDASENATVYDELFKVLFTIGIVLFVLMAGLVIYSLIKFRRKPGESEDGIAIEDNLPLEIFWTAVPTIVILFVGLYSYDIYDRMGGMQTLHSSHHEHAAMQSNNRIWAGIGVNSVEKINNFPSTPLSVEVTAQQFAFLFHYPSGDILSGELHVPIGEPINMRMESKDVIHAFWVPEFRIKQDIIPGQPTVLSFIATRAGRYPIICAELCGPYHGGMRSTVVVEKKDDYEKWFSKNKKTPEIEA